MNTSSGSTLTIQSQSTSAKQCDSGWIDARCCDEGSTQHLDPTRNSYKSGVTSDPDPNTKMATTTSLIQRTLMTMENYIACTRSDDKLPSTCDTVQGKVHISLSNKSTTI